MTQSLRRAIRRTRVSVHAVLGQAGRYRYVARPRHPKASQRPSARAIFDGVENGEEDIFPDPMSASMAESWYNGAAKAMERQMPLRPRSTRMEFSGNFTTVFTVDQTEEAFAAITNVRGWWSVNRRLHRGSSVRVHVQ